METIRNVVLFSVTLMQKSATGGLKSFSIFWVIFTQPTKSGCLCVFSACSLPSEGIFNIIGDEFGSIVPQERYLFKKFKAYNDVVECVYVCKLLKSLHVHVRGSTVTPFRVDTTKNSYQVLIASS